MAVLRLSAVRRVLLVLFFGACTKAVTAAGIDASTPTPTFASSDAGPEFPSLANAEPRLVVQAQFDALDAGDLNAHLARLASTLHAHLGKVDQDDVTLQLQRFVAQNLEEKRAAAFPLEVARVRREVLDYEAFKFETFVHTGVFPKRYFGYLDERFDTAAYETRLKQAATCAARACNRWLAGEKSTFHVTEQEIIVTFLAEGGAVLLREHQDQLEAIHPVFGIGLDDIAKGFTDLKPLVKVLDADCHTRLGEIVVFTSGNPRLARFFTFEEAIAGTAAMWVWEKRIAETKLAASGRPPLSSRSLAEQFVIASLVYNSGILFNQKTIDGVRDLNTGDLLFDLSEHSKQNHPQLPVLNSKQSLEWLLGGGDYPAQGTSWSAVYHVLQRYGAFVALSRFTDDFDATGRLNSSPTK